MIGGFTFKLAKPKVARTTNARKVISKLIKGTCFLDEDNIWKIHIPMSLAEDNSAMRVLEFTPKSYELRGKEYVFSKTQKGLNGKPICIIRTKEHAITFPGLESQYTPFCENWEYSGYIVKENNKTLFDIYETIGVYGYERKSTFLK